MKLEIKSPPARVLESQFNVWDTVAYQAASIAYVTTVEWIKFKQDGTIMYNLSGIWEYSEDKLSLVVESKLVVRKV